MPMKCLEILLQWAVITMYDKQIRLLGKEIVINVPGQGREKKQSERTVFAKLLSIGMNELQIIWTMTMKKNWYMIKWNIKCLGHIEKIKNNLK